ncbi:peptidoglycan/xylan/chitin deacetylase (PgdA/CDA1 family) [Clostridium tetanomorphum]|uniref:polysaccharide deacetylase family protein n=1 Tax=Clostridium tetanomorphum TaxID=1553 RepID=UPI00044BB7F0|nr:polysaccharide deacetylase family protein [Clostridium tetanomorphum]KAJ52536.1 polysaccharide deacetylase [Clostridium tetanomorphum DSM 665]MBP1863456.1 peptidoglycan/xylan/chitin deacetylase (PgdA/CDA1 family) [Clostridium tetanomorphum]NRS83553.1 peptidoglycan/xylan/chitin deacetylase (PgdA/CDA1 family) [Clostridium tetanomorphum]
MKKKYIIFPIILLVGIFIGMFIYKNYNVDTSQGKIIINKKSDYDASKEIKEALKLLDSSKKADIITNINTSSNVVSLSFEGLSNKDTMKKIIDALDKYKIKATFFIPGIKGAEDSSIVKMIQKGGHNIGSGTLSGKKNMEKLSNEELVTDFCSSNKILKSISGQDPILLKCNSTVYNDNILASAYASGNKYVVNSNHYLSYQSFKNYKEAYGYMNNLEKGAIVSIKLEGVLDSFEYGEKITEEKPAIDKQAGIKETKDKEEEKVTIMQIVEWILKSIDDQNKTVVKVCELPRVKKYKVIQRIDNGIKHGYINNDTYVKNNIYNKNNIFGKIEAEKPIYLINFKELIEKNNKRLSPVVSEFYTTQKALAYTFRGLSNEKSLDKTLKILQKLNAKGTFFVTKEEILNYRDRINKILSKGHEIGNGGVTTNSTLLNKSTEEICKEIYEVDKLLKERGITTNAYMPGYGYANDKVQEALSAMTNMPSLKDYELFTYSKAPILGKYRNMDATEIVPSYFNINSYVSLKKGEIVYFRLDSDLFKNDDVVANIIELLTKNYVQNGYAHKYNKELQSYNLGQKPLEYSVVTLSNLQNTIEAPAKSGRYNIKTNIIPMKKRTYEDALRIMKTNYIGNEDVDLADFTEDEKLSIDKTGTIDTNGESVIFFSFDDWGGDPIVNEILDILNKHKVKASFFVISKYTDMNSGVSNSNPNLLRTIALNGHDIGSHNYNHEVLEASREELEGPLIKSYNVMAKVIGDLDSLRPYFRPPTLHLRKEGLATVFESGYKYCISGNISTHDYEATSAQELVSYLEQELVKGRGNVIVMHMNNQSYYTAKALDIFLTNNEKGLYKEKYKIKKLSDYLEK